MEKDLTSKQKELDAREKIIEEREKVLQQDRRKISLSSGSRVSIMCVYSFIVYYLLFCLFFCCLFSPFQNLMMLAAGQRRMW